MQSLVWRFWPDPRYRPMLSIIITTIIIIITTISKSNFTEVRKTRPLVGFSFSSMDFDVALDLLDLIDSQKN